MIPIEETGVTQYTGTGSRTYFEYGFTFLEGSGVKVLVDGVTPVFTTQANGVVITPAPVLGAVVVLFRLTDVDQLRDWVPFDSFDAAWTEDAADKLIMLKSELHYRVVMNLTSEHLLDRIILHNDKGTDAHLLIWNELHPADDTIVSEAGVFAGEVTEDMPEPGTFVLKPDDFCYFQWGAAPAGFNQQVVTSTLYPIESEDGVSFGANVIAGDLREWPEDEMDVAFSLADIVMTEILLDDGTTEDEMDVAFSLAAIELTPILIDDGTTEDEVDVTFALVSVDMTPILVEAETRDDGVVFGATVVAGSLETP